MEARELGEFRLVERLTKLLGATLGADLIVGIGDDAAVWRVAEGAYMIATTDSMVENVHFLPGRVPWRDVGWKALAANVSDVAAMGGTPAFALITLTLPPGMPVEHLDALYKGLAECAESYRIHIVGGDIVSAPFFSITVALQGSAAVNDEGEPLLLRRNAARVGDMIAVSGPLGAPAGGLRALIEGKEKQHPSLVEAHLRPSPRVDAGRIAVASGIRCGIDISDGLVQDLGHVCNASTVGATVYLDRIPIDDNLRIAYRDDAAMMAATGGEDYELILIGEKTVLDLAEHALRQHAHAPHTPQLAIVGEITAGPPRVRVVDAAGVEVDVAHAGWDHLMDTRL
jgi:thiamine-monophosphate kinase